MNGYVLRRTPEEITNIVTTCKKLGIEINNFMHIFLLSKQNRPVCLSERISVYPINSAFVNRPSQFEMCVEVIRVYFKDVEQLVGISVFCENKDE